MPASNMDFDIVFVGGVNATALTKFVQTEGLDHKMALVTPTKKYVMPHAYFGCSHGHLSELALESGTVSAQVDPWSRTDTEARVVKYMPDQNKVLLSNGREYTYKALVLAPGLDHQESGIEGLADMYHNSHESENVFVHMLDNKERMSKNFWHGWNHTKGDMICYAPKDPHKGEGTDFWALYYESFLRQNHQIGRSAADTRIQFWSPNEYIYKFPYANEIALDECHKRGIDVNLGWEMTKVHYNEIGEKIATFKHVSTGETKEHPFMHANINPPSSPFQEIVDAGLGDHQGMIDVNPYTLQHNKYENIFAFGDAVAGETTRTQHSAVAQVPVVKHNLLNFMAGAELNGIYDGYTYMPFYLGHSNANCFQHLYDYEPAPMNHWVPNYGLFSEMYFKK
jgi:sulfide:quinone oxidoreductase